MGDLLGDLAQGLVLYSKIKRLKLMKCMKAQRESERRAWGGCKTLTRVIQIKLEAYEKCVLFRTQMHMDWPHRRRIRRSARGGRHNESHMKRKLRRLSFRSPAPSNHRKSSSHFEKSSDLLFWGPLSASIGANFI